MKVIIFPGTDCEPVDFWYRWLQKELKNDGYDATVAYYKDMNKIPIVEFLPKVLNDYKFDEETVLIGHSSGCPLILSILENTNAQIAKAVLVAGYSDVLSGTKDPILQTSYNWAVIKDHAKDFIFINSDNDPWGCDEKQGKQLFDNLGGTLVIRYEGHFGSQTMNQPFKQFPLLKTLVEGQV